MKNIIRNVIYIILASLMLGAFVYLGTRDWTPEPNHENDHIIMSRMFRGLGRNNIYEILDNKQLIRFLENGTGIVVFCFRDAPYCSYYLSILNDIVRESHLDSIFFYDILTDRETRSFYYQVVVNKSRQFLIKNDFGQHVLTVPAAFFVKDGELVGFNNDTSNLVGLVNPQSFWTMERREEFRETINDLIRLLLDEPDEPYDLEEEVIEEYEY